MSRLETYFNPHQDNRALDHLPGDEGLPLFGTTFALLRDPGGFIQEQHRKHGPVFRVRGLPRDQVALLGPDANQRVLLDREKVFSSRMGWMPVLEDLFPNGLMLRDFEDHHAHRRIMQAAFKREALDRYMPPLNRLARERLEVWRGQDRRLLYPSFKQLTLDIAAEIFLGMALGAEADRLNRAFKDCVAAAMAILRQPWPGTLYGRGVRGRAYLEQFFLSRIAARRESSGTDMFTRLCQATDEEGRRFTDREVVDHLIFLMMAAHDTLTSALTSLSYELARNPEWQTRVRRECEALEVGPDGDLRYDQLDQLVELEWAFKEALRKNPPLVVINRRTLREIEIGGHILPERTPVVVSLSFTHYMPELWREPHRFDPERFSPERAEDKVHRFAYLPFGGGAHLCIGMGFALMEAKVLMHHLLLRYQWSVPRDYTCAFALMPISHPKDGLPVQMRSMRP